MGLPARCGRGPCSFMVLSAAEGLPWGLGSLALQSESCSLSPFPWRQGHRCGWPGRDSAWSPLALGCGLSDGSWWAESRPQRAWWGQGEPVQGVGAGNGGGSARVAA